jgi:hypothetical protein
MATFDLFAPEALSELMCSAAASPARTFQAQEPRPVSTAREAAYGANTFESLARFDRDSSSWRTSQLCLGEGSTEFSGTWPRSGMTRSGIAYRLPTLAPRLTERGGIACGLWPTPVAGDAVGRGYHGDLRGNWWPALPGAIALSLGFPVQHPICAQINPEFVEWIMGYPRGHTELSASETPFPLTSRKSSDAQS